MENFEKVLRPIFDKKGCYLNDKLTVKSVLITSIPLFFLAECTLSMVNRWVDLNRRFLAMEDINLCLAALFVHYDITYLPSHMSSIMYMLKDVPNLEAFGELGVYTRELYEKPIIQRLRMINIVVIVMQLNVYALSLVQTLYEIFSKRKYQGGVLNASDLYLPFEFYHVVYIDTIQLSLVLKIVLFVAIYISHIFFFTLIADSGKIMYLSFYGPTKFLIYEMKLMGELIRKIDSFGSDGSQQIAGNFELYKLLSNTIALHATICRKVSVINKSIGIIAQTVFQCSCFQICLLFYWIAEVDDTYLFQLNDFIHVLAVAVYVYLYSSIGQEILNEDEILRNALYGCSWVDKPKWFRKSLMLMITRTNKRLEVKPFGLYVIGLNYFAIIMNAAYSYYSLLRSIK